MFKKILPLLFLYIAPLNAENQVSLSISGSPDYQHVYVRDAAMDTSGDIYSVCIDTDNNNICDGSLNDDGSIGNNPASINYFRFQNGGSNITIDTTDNNQVTLEWAAKTNPQADVCLSQLITSNNDANPSSWQEQLREISGRTGIST